MKGELLETEKDASSESEGSEDETGEEKPEEAIKDTQSEAAEKPEKAIKDTKSEAEPGSLRKIVAWGKSKVFGSNAPTKVLTYEELVADGDASPKLMADEELAEEENSMTDGEDPEDRMADEKLAEEEISEDEVFSEDEEFIAHAPDANNDLIVHDEEFNNDGAEDAPKKKKKMTNKAKQEARQRAKDSILVCSILLCSCL